MSNVISKEELFNSDVIDLDLSVTKKKRFRFDKDDSRILELNTSDMGIIARISEAYPKLNEQQEHASKIMEDINLEGDVTESDLRTVADRLHEVDTEMRDLIDYIFDSNVSEITAPNGSMYDPFNGSFRFEYIITLLIKQYETNLQAEFAKMDKQLNKHTSKYTKGKK